MLNETSRLEQQNHLKRGSLANTHTCTRTLR